MGAEIEWLSGVMRLGARFKKRGDPYDFICGVSRIGDTVAFIGANGEDALSLIRERHAVCAQLRSMGIKWMTWSHMKNGVEVWRRFPV
jgi:hypothetical protein